MTIRFVWNPFAQMRADTANALVRHRVRIFSRGGLHYQSEVSVKIELVLLA